MRLFVFVTVYADLAARYVALHFVSYLSMAHQLLTGEEYPPGEDESTTDAQVFNLDARFKHYLHDTFNEHQVKAVSKAAKHPGM